MIASLSPQELAVIHGVSPQLIRKLVTAGELRKVSGLGRSVRIPVDAAVAQFGPIPVDVLEAVAEQRRHDLGGVA